MPGTGSQHTIPRLIPAPAANQTFPKLEIADKSRSHWPGFGKV